MDLLGKIANVDREIARLLDRRYDLCSKAGQELRRWRMTTDEVEDRLLESIMGVRLEGLPPSHLEEIFQSIAAVYRAHIEVGEQILSCAFMGPTASFAHMAAGRCFGISGEYSICASECEVLEKVTSGKVRYAILAIENSQTGPYTRTLQRISNARLHVYRRVAVDAPLCLMGQGDIACIREIYGERDAFSQSDKNLKELKIAGLRAKRVTINETTISMLPIARKSRECALLGNPLIAKMWGLKAIVDHMEDAASNTTTFVVVGQIRNSIERQDPYKQASREPFLTD